ncbi:hypothetical protein [Shinella zoogloeoides]|uniref:hypothetical protein n=1 Tax=Shinella zoogloeoides TaxID=352475 RepID=UPI001F59E4C1|nr:hypothetical protein [Shinella zoogloeoides]
MSDGRKESRFLQKWKLVRAAARDNKRLSTGDIAVLMALCDRYGSKYDPDAPALAGHALLGAMAGLTRRATIDSTRRLIDAGYIAVIELGSGTRGTRYGLNFARGEDVITTAEDNASGEAEFTTVVNPSAPLDPRSGEGHFTESPPTESRLQAGLHVVGNEFEAAPTAPPGPGLDGRPGADPASGEGEEFAAFWSAWPRKHGKKKAETEWKRIDASLRGAVVVAAGKWAEHYATHDVDKKWIPEPANWLKDERWDEDLPLIHVDAKGAAIAKAKANAPAKPEPAATSEPPEPANDDIPDWMRGSPKLWPIGRHYGEFIDGEVVRHGVDTEVRMTFRRDDGTLLLHHFWTEAFIKSYQDEGQAIIRNILGALEMSNTDDTDDLLFKPLTVVADGETLTYEKISEAA